MAVDFYDYQKDAISKEHAYTYEAGYRDGSVHYELEHCPACKNVADLQEALEENAKLRELVRDIMPIVCDGCHERLCEMPKEEHPFIMCSFADRMRELGVDE